MRVSSKVSLFADCWANIDLGFAIEVSRSINQHSESNIERLLKFTSMVVDKFEISPQKTRIGIIAFGENPRLLFGFDRYVNR